MRKILWFFHLQWQQTFFRWKRKVSVEAYIQSANAWIVFCRRAQKKQKISSKFLSNKQRMICLAFRFCSELIVWNQFKYYFDILSLPNFVWYLIEFISESISIGNAIATAAFHLQIANFHSLNIQLKYTHILVSNDDLHWYLFILKIVWFSFENNFILFSIRSMESKPTLNWQKHLKSKCYHKMKRRYLVPS